MNPSKKAIFLDRDGILNKVVFREGKPGSPRSLEEFRLCEDVPHVLPRLCQLGYRLFVVSNQPDVSRGLLEKHILDAMAKRLKETLPIEMVLHCIHDDHDNCQCRKPKAGMFHEIADNHDIELKLSFLIGDSWKDILAGSEAGCKTVLLSCQYNREVEADFRIQNLKELVDIVSGESS